MGVMTCYECFTQNRVTINYICFCNNLNKRFAVQFGIVKLSSQQTDGSERKETHFFLFPLSDNTIICIKRLHFKELNGNYIHFTDHTTFYEYLKNWIYKLLLYLLNYFLNLLITYTVYLIFSGKILRPFHSVNMTFGAQRHVIWPT